MYVTVIPVLIIVGGIFAYRIFRPTDRYDLESSLDSEINRLFRDQTSHGFVIGVYKNDKTFIRGYGLTEKESGKVPDEKTCFQIGSITKVFTSALLQTLCDKNVLKLDSTLQELIGDTVALSDKVSTITLRQLSTHRSGLPRIPKPLLNKLLTIIDKKDALGDPYSHLRPEDIFTYLETAPDAGKAGRFAYSNYGTGLLGHVMEHVTGQSLDSLLRTELFRPLQMKHTGTTVTADIDNLLAQGYNPKGEPTGNWHFAVLPGAGAVYSNASDMLGFVQACVDENSFANALFRKMSTPQFGGKSGLGWLQAGWLEKAFGNADYVWHNGMVGGFASYISIDKRSKTGVVVLTSRAIDTTMAGITLTRQVRTQSWKDQ